MARLYHRLPTELMTHEITHWTSVSIKQHVSSLADILRAVVAQVTWVVAEHLATLHAAAHDKVVASPRVIGAQSVRGECAPEVRRGDDRHVAPDALWRRGGSIARNASYIRRPPPTLPPNPPCETWLGAGHRSNATKRRHTRRVCKNMKHKYVSKCQSMAMSRTMDVFSGRDDDDDDGGDDSTLLGGRAARGVRCVLPKDRVGQT